MYSTETSPIWTTFPYYKVLSRTPWTPGVMAAEDLANYSAAWREPVGGTYQGHQLWSMPPPASGAVLIMILNLLEGYGNFEHHFVQFLARFTVLYHPHSRRGW